MHIGTVIAATASHRATSALNAGNFAGVKSLVQLSNSQTYFILTAKRMVSWSV